MPPKRRAIVFRVKNVRYSPEIPEDVHVDLNRVSNLVLRLLEELQASGKPRTVMEYLEEAIVRLATEVVLVKASLESVREEGE